MNQIILQSHTCWILFVNYARVNQLWKPLHGHWVWCRMRCGPPLFVSAWAFPGLWSALLRAEDPWQTVTCNSDDHSVLVFVYYCMIFYEYSIIENSPWWSLMPVENMGSSAGHLTVEVEICPLHMFTIESITPGSWPTFPLELVRLPGPENNKLKLTAATVEARLWTILRTSAHNVVRSFSGSYFIHLPPMYNILPLISIFFLAACSE